MIITIIIFKVGIWSSAIVGGIVAIVGGGPGIIAGASGVVALPMAKLFAAHGPSMFHVFLCVVI
jgi:MFS superfamily sulfate permease-like transporter